MAQALALAVRRQHWELVALCLLVGLAQTLERVPPETLPALLALVDPAGSEAGRG